VFQGPDIFELGDDDVVTLLQTEISEHDYTRVSEAVASCPVAALSLDDD